MSFQAVTQFISDMRIHVDNIQTERVKCEISQFFNNLNESSMQKHFNRIVALDTLKRRIQIVFENSNIHLFLNLRRFMFPYRLTYLFLN